MKKISYHVIARTGGGWSIKKYGASRSTVRCPTKAEAVKAASKLVRKSGGGEIVIHKSDGRVIDRYLLNKQ